MDIANFGVEEWLNEWETQARYDLSQSTVSSMTLSEILSLGGQSPQTFFQDYYQTKMNYGHIEGSSAFKEQVAALYQNVDPANILQTNGATGANFLALYALIKPGNHLISMFPTYQQLYDIPRSFGAEVDFVYLEEANGWRLDIQELEQLIRPNTKMITLNSANNPTGTIIPRDDLEQIVSLARQVDAYILVDEVYAPFNDPDAVSIVDLYDRGIATNSLSKTFSVPGVRIGWTATSSELADLFRKYRDYTMICSGILDDAIAVHVLKNKDAILKRNRAIVDQNLTTLTKWVQSEPLVDLVYPDHVSTSFIKLDIPIPSKEFCIQLLQEEGVLLVPGSAYEIEGHARLGYCCAPETLQEGLKRISRFLNQYR